MKIIIVGGVAGGASCAARLRRLDENAEIVVLEKSGYMSYANCGLPYYIGGEIADEESLTLQTPESFWRRFRVDVRVLHEVTKINRAAKTIAVKNLANGRVYEEHYDKLVLSTGAKPAKPNMPGIENDRIFTLRNVEDTLKIKAYMDQNQPKTATVIGGGFIGVEMAENLRLAGLDVTLVEYADHVLAPFDSDMAAALHAKLEENGVKLMLKTAATGFADRGDRIETQTENGKLRSDMVILSIGVVPDTALAKDAGLILGIKNSIAVDEHMQTSDADIYAVGDAVEVRHFVTGGKTLISLAGPANKQGRIAADNIMGRGSAYRGSQGSSVIKVFDMTAASTGINEMQAKAAGIDYDKVVLSPMSHASYYPGGKVMTIKLLFEKGTAKILGAQMFGCDGVDKRIDVIATAIRAGLKATDLADLDLAYAPPYSSAKDPVNMAGFVCENVISGMVKQFHYEDVQTLPRDGSVFLLDSRTPMEYARGHAEGFVNIPVDDIRERLGEIPQNTPVYVMCQSGLRSYLTCRILSGGGYDCYNFSGGYRFYDIVSRGKKIADRAFPCGMEK